jgi:hypothetical protein
MMTNPVNANNGIVTNPNQLIYCPEQGTPDEHISKAFNAGIF